MLSSTTIPRRFAEELLGTLDAIRGESAALCLSGALSVSADDLLDGADGSHGWMADLAAAATGLDDEACDVALPAREPWALQQIVYTVSAVLVWADGLRREGRLRTVVTLECLAAWERVEHLAGMSGRTASALDVDPSALRRISTAAPVRRDSDQVDVVVSDAISAA